MDTLTRPPDKLGSSEGYGNDDDDNTSRQNNRNDGLGESVGSGRSRNEGNEDERGDVVRESTTNACPHQIFDYAAH